MTVLYTPHIWIPCRMDYLYLFIYFYFQYADELFQPIVSQFLKYYTCAHVTFIDLYISNSSHTSRKILFPHLNDCGAWSVARLLSRYNIMVAHYITFTFFMLNILRYKTIQKTNKCNKIYKRNELLHRSNENFYKCYVLCVNFENGESFHSWLLISWQRIRCSFSFKTYEFCINKYWLRFLNTFLRR